MSECAFASKCHHAVVARKPKPIGKCCWRVTSCLLSAYPFFLISIRAGVIGKYFKWNFSFQSFSRCTFPSFCYYYFLPFDVSKWHIRKLIIKLWHAIQRRRRKICMNKFSHYHQTHTRKVVAALARLLGYSIIFSCLMQLQRFALLLYYWHPHIFIISIDIFTIFITSAKVSLRRYWWVKWFYGFIINQLLFIS